MQIISSDSSCGRRLNSFPIRKGRILNIKNNESKNKRSKRSERLVVEAGVEASFVFEIARDISVGAACYWVSDEIAQRLQRQQISDSDLFPYERDEERRKRYVCFGMFDGATSYLWYSLVDKIFPSPSGGQNGADAVSLSALTASTTFDDSPPPIDTIGTKMTGLDNPELVVLVKKVVIDALLYNSLWAVGFIVIMALLRNETKQEIESELKRDWRDLYSNNLIFWVPLNFIVYGAIPLDFRVLSVYAFTITYIITLSVWEETRKEQLLKEQREEEYSLIVAMKEEHQQQTLRIKNEQRERERERKRAQN